MNRSLPNDFWRCYGVNCDKKQSCKRFLTIERDPEVDDKGCAIVRSYSATLMDKSTMLCDEFLENA